MKIFSRIISLVMIISILLTQFIYAENIDENLQFTDLDESHWAYESINKLVKAGYINGYPDGNFKPEGSITRAEFVKIANQVFRYSEKQEATNFTDVSIDEWFYEQVLIAQNIGYINGYPDGTFRPNDLISREELCKVLDTINNFVILPYETEIADDVSPWAVEYVNKVLSNRIMILNQNNNFRATEKATRAEACDALAKFIIEEAEEEPGLSAGGNSNSENNEITKEELYQVMNDTILILEKKIIDNSEFSDGQKEIVEDIIYNMEKYQQNNNHDYEEAARETYSKYSEELSESEQKELKEEIYKIVPTQDLIDLKDFFFPNVDIN